jgi:hypothetical protein
VLWGFLSEIVLFVFRLLPRGPRRWLRGQFSRERQQWLARQVFKTRRRLRKIPIGGTRRVWEGGRPLTARVVADVVPIELRRRTFDEVTAVLDAAGVTWFGWAVPVALEVAMIFVLGVVMLAIAVWEFSDTE